MKTAEEWRKEIPVFSNAKWTPETICKYLKQIQLDAMKEGMGRASRFCREQAVWQDSHYQILTASEQLTEKDL